MLLLKLPSLAAVLLLALSVSSACSAGAKSKAYRGEAPNFASSEDQRLALDDLNRYRAQHGAAPLRWSDALSRFAADASADLVMTQSPHAFFESRASSIPCLGAENQAPAWSGSIEQVIQESNREMMNEGPGGGHFENIVGKRYTHVGVAVFTHKERHYVTTNFGVNCRS